MEIAELIHKIESQPMQELTVSKFGRVFQIYPWLKVRYFAKYTMGKEAFYEKSNKMLLLQIRSLLKGFSNYFKRFDGWVFSNSNERVLLNKKYVDKSFDYLMSNTSMKILCFELQLDQRKRNLIPTKYLVSRAILMLAEEIYAKVFLRKIDLSAHTVLLKQLEQEMGVVIDVNSVVRKFLAQYRVMSLLLRVLPNPKFVLLTVSYTLFGYIQAFKERGIRVIELQHGLIGTSHSSFLYKSEYNPIQFPDEIWVNGERDAGFFENETKVPIKKAKVLGSYIVDFYKEKSKEKKEIISSISVTLQDGNLSEGLIEFLLTFNRQFPNQIEWKLKTRRTPEQVYLDQFEFSPNMSFTSLNAYEIIGQTDAHLTIFSTTAIEALSLGKVVLLYDFNGLASEMLVPIIGENKHVFVFKTPLEFMEILTHIQPERIDEIANSNSNIYHADYKKQVSDYLIELENELVKK
ncbi:MAG: hypothetical protein KJ941_00950 [Bacteroidetes bacterium]|nr:hypothetical protein [Bacteroidota bacterium]